MEIFEKIAIVQRVGYEIARGAADSVLAPESCPAFQLSSAVWHGPHISPVATYSTSDIRFTLAFAAAELRLAVAMPPVLKILVFLACAANEQARTVLRLATERPLPAPVRAFRNEPLFPLFCGRTPRLLKIPSAIALYGHDHLQTSNDRALP